MRGQNQNNLNTANKLNSKLVYDRMEQLGWDFEALANSVGCQVHTIRQACRMQRILSEPYFSRMCLSLGLEQKDVLLPFVGTFNAR